MAEILVGGAVSKVEIETFLLTQNAPKNRGTQRIKDNTQIKNKIKKHKIMHAPQEVYVRLNF